MQWVTDHALPSGVLAEQVHPFTNAPLSVSPLTWSHATFVTAVQEYLEKREQVESCPRCGQPLHRKLRSYEREEPDLTEQPANGKDGKLPAAGSG